MVSTTRLYQIDQRLKQAKPENADLPFGGMSVILMGDYAQLPPVKVCKAIPPFFCHSNHYFDLVFIMIYLFIPNRKRLSMILFKEAKSLKLGERTCTSSSEE